MWARLGHPLHSIYDPDMFQSFPTVAAGPAVSSDVADNSHLVPDFVVIDVETACSPRQQHLPDRHCRLS